MNDFVKAVSLNRLSLAQCQDITTTTQSCIAKWFKHELSVVVSNGAAADSKCLLSTDGERVLGISSVAQWLSMSLDTEASVLNLSTTLQNKAVTLFLQELLQAFNKTDTLIKSLQLAEVSSTVPAPYQLSLSVSSAERDFVITFYPAFFLRPASANLSKTLSGRWHELLAANDIRLDVNAGKVRLTLAELAGIAPGDVLPLGQGIKNEFEITIKDRLITTARLAIQAGKRVAVLQNSEEE